MHDVGLIACGQTNKGTPTLSSRFRRKATWITSAGAMWRVLSCARGQRLSSVRSRSGVGWLPRLPDESWPVEMRSGPAARGFAAARSCARKTLAPVRSAPAAPGHRRRKLPGSPASCARGKPLGVPRAAGWGSTRFLKFREAALDAVTTAGPLSPPAPDRQWPPVALGPEVGGGLSGIGGAFFSRVPCQPAGDPSLAVSSDAQLYPLQNFCLYCMPRLCGA